VRGLKHCAGKRIRISKQVALHASAWIDTRYLSVIFPLYNAVNNHGKWDYKRQGENLEEFGNFHFGVVAKAHSERYPFFSERFKENFILRGAGLFHQRDNPTHTEYGKWYKGPPYGDDPRDQDQIRAGFRYLDYLNRLNRRR